MVFYLTSNLATQYIPENITLEIAMHELANIAFSRTVYHQLPYATQHKIWEKYAKWEERWPRLAQSKWPKRARGLSRVALAVFCPPYRELVRAAWNNRHSQDSHRLAFRNSYAPSYYAGGAGAFVGLALAGAMFLYADQVQSEHDHLRSYVTSGEDLQKYIEKTPQIGNASSTDAVLCAANTVNEIVNVQGQILTHYRAKSIQENCAALADWHGSVFVPDSGQDLDIVHDRARKCIFRQYNMLAADGSVTDAAFLKDPGFQGINTIVGCKDWHWKKFRFEQLHQRQMQRTL
jgi:hypothetical protein